MVDHGLGFEAQCVARIWDLRSAIGLQPRDGGTLDPSSGARLQLLQPVVRSLSTDQLV